MVAREVKGHEGLAEGLEDLTNSAEEDLSGLSMRVREHLGVQMLAKMDARRQVDLT